MARSRKRSFGRRRRMKADWTYRHNVRFDSGSITSYGGWSNDGDTFTISGAGSSNEVFVMLYDSNGFLRQAQGITELESAAIPTGGLATSWLARAARAGGKKPTACAVQGDMFIIPGTWTFGSRFLLKARLGWWEQDPHSGQILVDPAYSIFELVFSTEDAAIWANDSQTHIADFVAMASADVDGIRTSRLPIRWKGKRMAPSENHCLGLLLETASTWTNQSLRILSQVRAAIHDPNA